MNSIGKFSIDLLNLIVDISRISRPQTPLLGRCWINPTAITQSSNKQPSTKFPSLRCLHSCQIQIKNRGKKHTH
ncbi:hypothetical protein EUGRSUZ_G02407 [Eucalyptus grandis]|uniref:Uncharacterized protein n=2 Tax=Eucalyptus grandis TaxID=71139 RepID=A0ACC3K5Y2_EUCGR|nr:hypothetical protein EUGRSUZ_G02407 [Eucalyptus grandis]